jgi:hypothetical protein
MRLVPVTRNLASIGSAEENASSEFGQQSMIALASSRTLDVAALVVEGLPTTRPQSEGESDIGQLPSRQVLTPVVDHVDARPIESVRMRALHGDALHRYAITVGAHAPVGIFTG